MDDEESYHFLDKLVQCVFPRIREWVSFLGSHYSSSTSFPLHFSLSSDNTSITPLQEGLEPVVETSKSGEHTELSFILPSQSLGTFPDIEPHFDSFPRLFDTLVRY